MYVLIDRDAMVFRHKHPLFTVVSNLANIEVCHCKAAILPTTGNGKPFQEFTDLELKLLYENTTGNKFTGFSRLHLLEMVLDTARRLPVSDVREVEVMQQAMKIGLEDKGFYRYVKGAYTAKRLEDLFEPTALAVKPGAPLDPATEAPAPVQEPRKQVAPAAVFTQPLPAWHPLYKAQQAGL